MIGGPTQVKRTSSGSFQSLVDDNVRASPLRIIPTVRERRQRWRPRLPVDDDQESDCTLADEERHHGFSGRGIPSFSMSEVGTQSGTSRFTPQKVDAEFPNPSSRRFSKNHRNWRSSFFGSTMTLRRARTAHEMLTFCKPLEGGYTSPVVCLKSLRASSSSPAGRMSPLGPGSCTTLKTEWGISAHFTVTFIAAPFHCFLNRMPCSAAQPRVHEYYLALKAFSPSGSHDHVPDVKPKI